MPSDDSTDSVPMPSAKVDGTSNYVERVNTNEEKSGLKAYADDEHLGGEPPLTAKRILALIAMAFLWTGSQIPLYLFGGVPPYIYGDLGGLDRWTWFVLGNLLALASVCPFVGSLSDLLGRRYVALLGGAFLMIGMVVCSTASTMNNFIGGMAISGVGAGICELTSLAVTSELAPTSKRGKYVSVLILTIIPFCPSVLWGQLIAYHSSWRWIGLFCGLWALMGFVLTAIFYFPPPRVNSHGLSKREVLSRIDYVGGVLSIGGMLLVMMALEWGGYQYAWSSVHVLVPLLLGIFLLIGFAFWEKYGAKYAMFPGRIMQAPRTLLLTLVVTAIAGANFFSVLLFWPTAAYNVYGHDPVQVGLKGVPIGFSILTGACVVLFLLSVLRGNNRELMIFSAVCMTAGCGAMSAARVDNMYQVWGILILAGLGIGGLIVPPAIITTIICPSDLIATVSALTLSVRVIGGSLGYAIYYNVFYNKFVPNASYLVGGTLEEVGITSVETITEIIGLTGAGLVQEIRAFPPLDTNETAYNMVIAAGQLAFAESYPYVYYTSIAFGSLSIICCCFLGDIKKFMTDEVAVVMG